MKILDYSKLVVPKHVAIVMDGNRRWSKARFVPNSFGYSEGSKVVDRTVDYAQKIGIEHLTLFAFSSENWKRSKLEIDFLMSLLYNKLKELILRKLKNVRIKFIGRKSKISDKLFSLMEEVERYSSLNSGILVNVAIDYGSREEIVNASKKILEDVYSGKIFVDELNENLFNNYLYTCESPDVDLFIRTSGENRFSNFLLWQSSYAEFVSTKVLWPDFSNKDLDSAIAEFNRRNRTFGS